MCSLIMICCRLFLEKAKGSFVLNVVSSLDARRHVSFVARYNTILSTKKGFICFESEQAAVEVVDIHLRHRSRGRSFGC
ncbi:hypothetical protein ACHAXN_000518 [Cyclotella atomus]